jgi:hypothetical protein
LGGGGGMSPSPTTTTTTTVRPEYVWRNGAYRPVTTPKPPRGNFERWKPPGSRRNGYDVGACGGGGGCGEDWLSDTVPILCKILVSSPFDGAPRDCGGGGCAAGGCGKIHDRKTGIWRCQPHPDPMNPAGTKCKFNPNKEFALPGEGACGTWASGYQNPICGGARGEGDSFGAPCSPSLIREATDFDLSSLKKPCNCKGGGGAKPGWKPPLGRPGACDPWINNNPFMDKFNSIKQTYGRVPYLKSVYDPPGGKESCSGSPHDICTIGLGFI